MPIYPHLEQAMHVWVDEAVGCLTRAPKAELSRGLERWQRDSDDIFRKRERLVSVWQHSELDAIRQLASWRAVEDALQSDDRLRAQLDHLVGTAEGARLFDAETAASLVLPLPQEVKDTIGAFARRYGNLESFLVTEEIESVVIWPLPGLASNEFPIQLEPDVALDLMSDDELAAALNTEVLRPAFPGMSLLDPSEEKDVKACLRYRYRLPKVVGENRQSPEVSEEKEERLTILRERMEQVLALLFTDPVAVSGRITFHLGSSLLSGGTLFQPTPLLPTHRFRQADLDTRTVAEVVETWRQLSQPNLLQRQKALALALRRLSYQAYRQRIEDEMIDVMVAAESLYLSRTETQELGFRLALRATALSDSGALGMTRREVFDLMKAAYNARSTLVHGDELKPKDLKVKGAPVSLPDFVQATEDVVRQGLRKAINKATDPNGRWPPDWDEMTLPK